MHCVHHLGIALIDIFWQELRGQGLEFAVDFDFLSHDGNEFFIAGCDSEVGDFDGQGICVEVFEIFEEHFLVFSKRGVKFVQCERGEVVFFSSFLDYGCESVEEDFNFVDIGGCEAIDVEAGESGGGK